MIKNFEKNLQKYAELIIQTGIDVDKGQTVVVQINIDQQELANLIVKERSL